MREFMMQHRLLVVAAFIGLMVLEIGRAHV